MLKPAVVGSKGSNSLPVGFSPTTELRLLIFFSTGENHLTQTNISQYKHKICHYYVFRAGVQWPGLARAPPKRCGVRLSGKGKLRKYLASSSSSVSRPDAERLPGYLKDGSSESLFQESLGVSGTIN